MEVLDIPAETIVVHVPWILLPFLLGIATGGGLGVLCALGLRRACSAGPWLRRLLVLLPWRTLTMGLLVAVWSPFVASLLGLGLVTGGAMAAATVCLLTTPFVTSTLLEHWHPPSLAGRLVAGARTLAVGAGLVALGVGMLGGGGLGHTILEAVRLAQYGVMWQGLLLLLALALAADLSLGLAQVLALRRPGERDTPRTARG